ncbi:MAG: hypothetical protein ACYC7A_10150 [Thermoanaerobaculia bacterium]
MTGFLASLPHGIPFRAASTARRIDERTVEGSFLVTIDDALAEGEPPFAMLVEAMAQIGGSLVFTGSAHGYLSAIDEFSTNGVIGAGDAFTLRVTLDATFGSIHRFTGIALREGLEYGRAKFYLAKPE